MFQSQKYTDLSCQNGDLELVFLIDSSGSTRANGDFFRASKDWISGFLKFFNLENLKVGLVSFAEDARVVLPLRNLPIQRVEKRLKSIFAQEYWFYLSCFFQIWNYFFNILGQMMKFSKFPNLSPCIRFVDFWSKRVKILL